MHGNEELSKQPASVCEPPEGKATVPSRNSRPSFCQTDESDDENPSSDSSLQSHQPEMTSTSEPLVPPDHSTVESSQQDKSSTVPLVDTSKIKCGSSVSFELKGKHFSGHVISRAGKAKGRHCNWYNVRTQQESLSDCSLEDVNAYDLSKVEKLTVSEGDTVAQSDDAPDEADQVLVNNVVFEKAKSDELSNWVKLGVYREVDDTGQPRVSSRWVLSIKNDGTPKARLVARGFEDEELMPYEKQSPTCSKEAIRLIMTISAIFSWPLESIDIKFAFLQGDMATRTVHLQPPKEAATNKLWLLTKCVYGLSDASLGWYKKLKSSLESLGCSVTPNDRAVFVLKKNGVLHGLVAVHVDDIIWTGDDLFVKTVIEQLRVLFQVRSFPKDDFTYLGLKVSRCAGDIQVSQSDYVDMLQFIDKRNFADNELYKLCRSRIGQIMWLASQTRPDLCFDVNCLSSDINSFDHSIIPRVNKVIKKAKTASVCIKFPVLDLKSLSICAFSDASLGNVKNGGSQGGYIVFLRDSKGTIVPLTWCSKRLKRVVRSTLAAECLALGDALDHAIFIRNVLSDVLGKDISITCFTDNNDLKVALSSHKDVAEKRLRLDIMNIKDAILHEDVTIKWTDTKNQLADVFTKAGGLSDLLLETLLNSRLPSSL